MDGATFNSVFTFLALNRRYNKTENYDIIFATLVIRNLQNFLLSGLFRIDSSYTFSTNCLRRGTKCQNILESLLLQQLYLQRVCFYQAVVYSVKIKRLWIHRQNKMYHIWMKMKTSIL